MEIRLHRELAVFAELTGPLYGADPVSHTIALTAMAQRLAHPATAGARTLLSAHDGTDLVGAALRTPPWPLVVSGLSVSAVPAAAAALVQHDPELGGVSGPRDRAEAFAEAWSALTGATVRTVRALRLFRLAGLTPPSGVPGQARTASTSHLEAAFGMQRAFAAEAVPHDPGPEPDEVRRQLAGGGATVFWEVAGEPVAMARAEAPAAGMSRIGWVYTSPVQRGHGYGSAATAAASRWALDAGCRHVVLFTDVADPTTNASYPRLGYRPVHDAVHLGFLADGPAGPTKDVPGHQPL